jgi:DNA-binding transcriptional regulator YbjK
MAARAEGSDDRRARLVQEALGLVAGGGLAAVTHRAVETAAGVPHGSVTYWFGSRDGLVAAMVDQLVAESEREVAAIALDVAARMSAGGAPDATTVAAAVAAWIERGADMHVARMELELAAVRDPRLRARMRDAAQVFWRLCEPLVRAAGSSDPERDARAMAAMVDGLLLDRLAHPPQGDDVLATAVRQLLRSWRPDAPDETIAAPARR